MVKLQWLVPDFLVVLLAAFLLSSCTTVKPEMNRENEGKNMVSLDSIVILPVEIPFDQEYVKETGLNRVSAGRDTLSKLLTEYFAERKDVDSLSRSQQEGLLIDFRGSRMARARKIGRQLGKDAVLLITINRFVLRDASQSRPASVAFEYKLLEVESGQVSCGGVFDETQQALFENVFSLPRAFSRKFKWITAEDLAREGIEARFGSCFHLRR